MNRPAGNIQERNARSANHRHALRLPYVLTFIGEDGDATEAAHMVLERCAERGEHLVMVAPTGGVYVVSAKENKADLLAQNSHAWVAGWFNARMMLKGNFIKTKVEDIAEAMRETYLSLRGERA